MHQYSVFSSVNLPFKSPFNVKVFVKVRYTFKLNSSKGFNLERLTDLTLADYGNFILLVLVSLCKKISCHNYINVLVVPTSCNLESQFAIPLT